MHKQQREFCMAVKAKAPEFFVNKRVLDVGSGDINGNNRYLFDGCDYTGVDVTPGPNVDYAMPIHMIEVWNKGHFDVVISTECWEHDPYFVDSIRKCLWLLKPGGLFLWTCATTGRLEHGTVRSHVAASLGALFNLPKFRSHYRNITQQDVEHAIDLRDFSDYHFAVEQDNHDLYFWGIRGTTDYTFKRPALPLPKPVRYRPKPKPKLKKPTVRGGRKPKRQSKLKDNNGQEEKAQG